MIQSITDSWWCRMRGKSLEGSVIWGNVSQSEYEGMSQFPSKTQHRVGSLSLILDTPEASEGLDLFTYHSCWSCITHHTSSPPKAYTKLSVTTTPVPSHSLAVLHVRPLRWVFPDEGHYYRREKRWKRYGVAQVDCLEDQSCFVPSSCSYTFGVKTQVV